MRSIINRNVSSLYLRMRMEKLLVATCENINPTDLELKGNTSWLELSQEEGKIYAKVQKMKAPIWNVRQKLG